MKRTLPILLVAALPALALAGGVDPSMTATAQTNTTATVAYTNDSVVSGTLDAIYFDVTGVNTCTVNVATAANRGNGPAKSLLTKTSLSADGWYFVRSGAVGITASAITDSNVPFPLAADKLVLTAYSATTTNSFTVQAFVYYK